MEKFKKSAEQMDLASVLVFKQEILTNHLSDFVIELSKECKEKSDILLFLWNSVFNIVELLVESLGKVGNIKEK